MGTEKFKDEIARILETNDKGKQASIIHQLLSPTFTVTIHVNQFGQPIISVSGASLGIEQIINVLQTAQNALTKKAMQALKQVSQQVSQSQQVKNEETPEHGKEEGNEHS